MFLSLIPLKHRGEADFPITIGISFSPAAFTKNAKVMRIFAFFATLQALFASARVLSGNARKRNQFCPHSIYRIAPINILVNFVINLEITKILFTKFKN